VPLETTFAKNRNSSLRGYNNTSNCSLVNYDNNYIFFLFLLFKGKYSIFFDNTKKSSLFCHPAEIRAQKAPRAAEL